jgi:DNA/RNA endonuclease YhcR with UshA esterase domain
MGPRTVRLSDNTVGTIELETVTIGDTVTVSLRDENGMPMTATGELVEVLEGEPALEPIE